MGLRRLLIQYPLLAWVYMPVNTELEPRWVWTDFTELGARNHPRSILTYRYMNHKA